MFRTFAVVVLLSQVSAPPASAQPASAVRGSVTFAKDVAPILQKNCQTCHRAGDIAPMSLRTYEEVRPWARSIKAKVVAREMPPYRYDHQIGIQKLKDDLRLSEKDIQTIVRWVDGGAPLGNVADLPAPRQFPDGTKWAYQEAFGPPDLIVPTKPYTVPAQGQDRWWRPIVPIIGSTEDRCIKAMAVKPSLKGRAAAHHANSDLMVPDEKSGSYVTLERVSEYASGKTGEIVPPDGCRTLPANAMIRWDVHYWPYGEEVKDDVVELAFWFYPKDHKAKYKQDLKLYTLLMKGGELEMAPHSTTMTQGFHTFKTPVRIDSFQPHGHSRLVGKTAEIFYPDTGKLEMVSSVSNWTNYWHTSHVYEDDVAPLLPVGAVLVLTGYYDNTAKNKGNPDPDQWVGGGSRTSDEMSHAWITVTHLDDAGYKQILADREAKAAKTTTTSQQDHKR